MAHNQLATMRSTRRSAIAVAATAAVLIIGACSDGAPSPDAQRETMIKTTRAVIDNTKSGTFADQVEVLDDGTTAHPCPDGGARYTYAATIGPADWEIYAASLAQGLSRLDTRMIGMMTRLQSDPDPALDYFPRFDDQEYVETTNPEDPRSASYFVTHGDNRGVTLSFEISISRNNEIYTDVAGATRCG